MSDSDRLKQFYEDHAELRKEWLQADDLGRVRQKARVEKALGELFQHNWRTIEDEMLELRAIAQAAREAGMVKDGKLIPPTCYWTEDGDPVNDPEDDLCCNYDTGCVVEYRAAWGGKREWWTLGEDSAPIGPFASKEEARSAAEAAKGGGDA